MNVMQTIFKVKTVDLTQPIAVNGAQIQRVIIHTADGLLVIACILANPRA